MRPLSRVSRENYHCTEKQYTANRIEITRKFLNTSKRLICKTGVLQLKMKISAKQHHRKPFLPPLFSPCTYVTFSL